MFGLSQLAERALWILILVLVTGGAVFGFAWHERRLGAQGCVRSVDKASSAETQRETTQHAGDVKTASQEGTNYVEQLTSPLPLPAPVIHIDGVCPALHREAVPTATAPGSASHADATDRGQGAGGSLEIDTTPVVRDARDADAQITGLQAYIRDVCRPK